MIKSMTGYGRSIVEVNGKNITIEVRSLNSKQIDIYTKIPGVYKEKELDIRNVISQKLKRGKIECCITVEQTNSAKATNINTHVIKEYYQQINALSNELKLDTQHADILQVLMRMPDVMSPQSEELDEQEWTTIEEKLLKAISIVEQFRLQEGSALSKDIAERVEQIVGLGNNIKSFEKERINHIRERILNTFNEYIENDKIDPNRLEQELIYYLEKVDITEELVRLKNHCIFFNEVLNGNKSEGKKLSFISQEMGREINTIGSKANNSDIQRIVVQMKDELEKIKEQLMNVL